ncbi:MAG: GerMN domain-containing protein [Actinobacteria bacterium]|nr:GerMN domain-containing protein [Actinomycetota bacterium]
MTRRRLSISVVLVAGLSLVSCGVPTSSEVLSIAESELPTELRLESTTTSTTTTTTTSTVPETANETATTIAEVVSEPVEIYYISANRVVATNLSIVSPATTAQVLAALVSGPPSGEAGLGLRTALPKSLDASVFITKGVAQIDTSAEFLTELTPIDQRLAIAQLVLTFTRRPGVGQVVFSVEGEFVAVPRGRGDLAKPGTAVSFDEYASLITRASG